MRGVTTRSPTRASIQVNCTPGSPAQQSVGRIDGDAEPRAALVPLDDLGEDREDARQRPGISGGRHVAAPRLDVPERGIGRVVFRGLPGAGENIRQHALVDKAREGFEDLAGVVVTAGGETQARQGDHRVPPPIAEPRIARDHRSPVRNAGNRPPDDIKIGGQDEPQHPAGRGVEKRVRVERPLQHCGVVRPAARQCGADIRGRIAVETGDKPMPCAVPQREFGAADTQIVVALGEAALALDRQVEILDPRALRNNRTAGRGDAQRKAVLHAHGELVAFGTDLGGKARHPGLAVMVAPVGEDRHREKRVRAAARRHETPGEVSRVRPRLHPDPLLDADVADRGPPHRDGAVEVKTLDRKIALGRHGAACAAIGEKWDPPIADDQFGVGLGQHEASPKRRVDRRNQEDGRVGGDALGSARGAQRCPVDLLPRRHARERVPCAMVRRPQGT